MAAMEFCLAPGAACVTLSCCPASAELKGRSYAAAGAGVCCAKSRLHVPASVCHFYFNPATAPVCAPPHHHRPIIIILHASPSSASSLSPFRTLSDPSLRMRQTRGFNSSSTSCECRLTAATSHGIVLATIALKAYILWSKTINDLNPEEDQIRREDLGPSVDESLTVCFDAAEEYDLTAGGNFTAVALGFIPYAEGYSTFLNGSTVGYYSNELTAIDVKDSCEGDLLAQVVAASFLYWSLRATNAMPMASSMASQDHISRLPNELLLLVLEKFANKEDLKSHIHAQAQGRRRSRSDQAPWLAALTIARGTL